MKKLKLSKEEYESLRSQFISSDKEAHVLALKTIEHCDIAESLVFVLLLYKEFNDKIEGGLKSKKLTKELSDIKITLDDRLTINQLWKYIRKYPKAERAIALEYLSSILKPKIESWGFSMLKDLQLSITERE